MLQTMGGGLENVERTCWEKVDRWRRVLFMCSIETSETIQENKKELPPDKENNQSGRKTIIQVDSNKLGNIWNVGQLHAHCTFEISRVKAK